MEKDRLQKILSRSGYGSRRECEKIIADGFVTVNNQLAKLGDKADYETDIIRVNNNIIAKPESDTLYLAFYKPRKVLSEIKKLDDRMIITDFIPLSDYFFIVGRLDFDSEGLILLTNDGEIANQLTHPRYEHEKEYHVQVSKAPDPEQLNIWRKGVVIEGGYRTMPARVDILPQDKTGKWLRVILKEGKKRQIREIGISIGLPVKRIIRRRIGPVEVGRLNPGEWRRLTSQEIRSLKNLQKSIKSN
ncbi:MAG: pseudouridine synthase [Pelolinea sp.]|nr:pseudouridine synthase [Pelolinea sp.]